MGYILHYTTSEGQRRHMYTQVKERALEYYLLLKSTAHSFELENKSYKETGLDTYLKESEAKLKERGKRPCFTKKDLE